MDQERRIAELESRVAELERRLEAVEFRPQRRALMEGKRTEERPPVLPLPEKEPVDWETLIGRVWLPRVFVMVLLIGVVWAFKASIDRGYLTEPVRVALGFGLTGALIWLGWRQMVRARAALGQVLLGGAVVVSMLTTFAMHMLYGFIPAAVAFPLNIVWIAGGVWLSIRYQSQALAVLSSLAGVLIPFLVESREPNVLFFTAYEVMLYLTFLFVAMWKQYKVLYYSSAALLQLVFLVFFISSGGEGGRTLAVGSVLQHLFLLVYLLRSSRYRRSQYGALLTTFGLSIFWMQMGLSDLELELALLVWTVLYSILAFKLYGEEREKAAVAASVGSLALAVYVMEAWSGQSETALLLLEGTLALYLAVVLQSRWQWVAGGAIYFLGLLGTVPRSLEELVSMEMLNWLLLLGSAAWLYRLYRREVSSFTGWIAQGSGLVYAGLLLLFLTDVTGVVLQDFTYEIRQLAISAVWAAYAVAGLVYGARTGHRDVRRLGMGLLLITLLKAVFFDVPSLSLVVRAILFIGLGAIGLMMSRLFYSSKDKK